MSSSPNSISSSASSTSLSSARARHVFGDRVLDLAESPIGSLTYSPSPASGRLKSPDIISHSDRNDSETHPKMIDFARNKENHPDNQHQNNKTVSYTEEANNKFHPKNERNRPQPTSQSPKKRDLVKKTQDAINSATISVNQTLIAARLSKTNFFLERSTETAKLRDQWRDEKEEAKEFHADAEKNRQEFLKLKKQLSTKFCKTQVNHDQLEKRKQLEALIHESEFKSEVFREHQLKVKDERDSRRRESADKRAKIRTNHREGEEKLHLIKIGEDQALYDERYAVSVATQAYKTSCANERRISFQFRGGDARRIRAVHDRIKAGHQAEVHASYELKFASDRDADAYRQVLKVNRRDSFAFRQKEARNQREKEQLQRNEEKSEQHASYELKFASERDVDEYRKLLSDIRRKSFAFRNEENQQQNKKQTQQACEVKADLHKMYELKWAGENDAEVYQQHLQEGRRKSLAVRNLQGKQSRDEEQHRQMETQALEHDSYELKFAGERDIVSYREKTAKERRDSFAFRNEEGRKQREKWSQRQCMEAEVAHHGYELKWASEQDVEAYKIKLEKVRRESLNHRNQERAQHAKVMEEIQSITKEQNSESLILKWAGENDTKEYLARKEEERRKSFAFRNQEGKRHRALDVEACNTNLLQAHTEELLQAAGKSYLLLFFGHKNSFLIFVSARTDVENYKRDKAERDRLSLECRRKEANIQRLEEDAEQQRQREIRDGNKLLEDKAWGDVQEYIQDCQQRKRLSLVFRAREKREHFQWKRQEEARKLEQRSQDYRFRGLDRRHQDMERRKERARIALDAIQHTNCTFSRNPFGHLD